MKKKKNEKKKKLKIKIKIKFKIQNSKFLFSAFCFHHLHHDRHRFWMAMHSLCTINSN